MDKYKKLTNGQLLISLEGVLHNSEHHPFKDGRDFYIKQVQLINKEISHRKSNNQWDEHSAKNGKAYLLHMENMNRRRNK